MILDLPSARRALAGLALGASFIALAACASTEPEREISSDVPVGQVEDAGYEDNPAIEVSELGYPATLGEAGEFAVFEPKADGRAVAIDYGIIDDALDLIVLNTGPSLRTAAPSRTPQAGTRLVSGHKSKVRLEGNKVFFSQFDRPTTQSFREYADSLIAIGNQIDITSLPRNDQLAYWFNLHNILVIATIAEQYPESRPRTIKIAGQPFHDAKMATIQGVDLSLSDIRRNIVYRYWSDPRVMYGFFHGDLASPNIRDRAWRGDNLDRGLNSNAREFVNSLRGVSEGRQNTLISPLFYEAQPGLFPDWPSDLRQHLRQFAKEDVELILLKNKPVGPRQYEDRTADLVGGAPKSQLSPVDTADPARNYSTSPEFAEMAREMQQKFETLRKEGQLSTRVIIIDQPTEDRDPDAPIE